METIFEVMIEVEIMETENLFILPEELFKRGERYHEYYNNNDKFIIFENGILAYIILNTFIDKLSDIDKDNNFISYFENLNKLLATKKQEKNVEHFGTPFINYYKSIVKIISSSSNIFK